MPKLIITKMGVGCQGKFRFLRALCGYAPSRLTNRRRATCGVRLAGKDFGRRFPHTRNSLFAVNAALSRYVHIKWIGTRLFGIVSAATSGSAQTGANAVAHPVQKLLRLRLQNLRFHLLKDFCMIKLISCLLKLRIILICE